MDVEKTPVSILQEMMAKIGTTPHYEFQNGSDSNSKIFTCNVTCDGITATGSGRSKKDAKQNTACAMLEKLNKRKVVAQPSIVSDESSVKIFESSVTLPTACSENVALDSVQELQRLCSKYTLNEPIYKDLDSLGPVHARTFIVQCKLSTFEVDGSGRSKKQAKHDAAKKMIEQVKDTFCINGSSIKNETKKIKKTNMFENNFNTTSNHSQMSAINESAKLKISYDLKMKSECKQLMQNLKEAAPNILLKLEHLSTLINECQENHSEENITKVKQEFQNLFESAKIDFHHMLLKTVEPVTFMLIIQLNTVPDILEMSLGSTREEAELHTMNKVIETLKVYLK